LIDRAQDCFEHAIRILQHIVIPESQYEATHRFQDSGSVGLAFKTLIVLPAIDFYDEPPVGTVEIDNKSFDWDLSLEFPTRKSAIAQAKPQHPLGVCLIATQSPGRFCVAFRHPTPLTPTLSPRGRGSPPRSWRCRRQHERQLTPAGGRAVWP
jgi:hypothetical protein